MFTTAGSSFAARSAKLSGRRPGEGRLRSARRRRAARRTPRRGPAWRRGRMGSGQAHGRGSLEDWPDMVRRAAAGNWTTARCRRRQRLKIAQEIVVRGQNQARIAAVERVPIGLQGAPDREEVRRPADTPWRRCAVASRLALAAQLVGGGACLGQQHRPFAFGVGADALPTPRRLRRAPARRRAAAPTACATGSPWCSPPAGRRGGCARPRSPRRSPASRRSPGRGSSP